MAQQTQPPPTFQHIGTLEFNTSSSAPVSVATEAASAGLTILDGDIIELRMFDSDAAKQDGLIVIGASAFGTEFSANAAFLPIRADGANGVVQRYYGAHLPWIAMKQNSGSAIVEVYRWTSSPSA